MIPRLFHAKGSFYFNNPAKIYLFKTTIDVVLVSLLLTLNIFHTFFSVSNIDLSKC